MAPRTHELLFASSFSPLGSPLPQQAQLRAVTTTGRPDKHRACPPRDTVVHARQPHVQDGPPLATRPSAGGPAGDAIRVQGLRWDWASTGGHQVYTLEVQRGQHMSLLTDMVSKCALLGGVFGASLDSSSHSTQTPPPPPPPKKNNHSAGRT